MAMQASGARAEVRGGHITLREEAHTVAYLSWTCTVTNGAIPPSVAASAAATHPSVAAWSAALLYRRLTAIHATLLLLQASIPSWESNTPCKE
eukprot:4562168-Lingulodinium_polyedra.AAC.1